MDFAGYLEVNAQKINKKLDEILLEFLNETKRVSIKLLPFATAFLNSCKGGKRIRGVLTGLGYEIAGGKGGEIVKVGAAFEILHTALLIHDDIIDQSPARRGQPSLHEALGGNHYGVSQAISLGDIGLYLPVKIITQTAFPVDFKLKALNYFSQILINTGWGQMMDVEKSPDQEFVNLYKTAKYTIAGPLQIGAILAGADESLIRKLGEFGQESGLAFQIQDDILDKEVKDIDKARAKAVKYADKARKKIAKITEDIKMRKLLRELTKFLVERTK